MEETKEKVVSVNIENYTGEKTNRSNCSQG